MRATIAFFSLLLALAPSTAMLGQERTLGIQLATTEAYPGYTLYSPHNDTSVYLINNCGELVHQWHSRYQPGNAVYLMPDGTLYRAGRWEEELVLAMRIGGAGGIIERLDWESNVIWSYRYAADTIRHHHDFQVLENGNVLLLAWGLVSTEEAVAMGRDAAAIDSLGLWPEQVVEIKPTGTNSGEIVWYWNSWDHLVQDRDSTKPNYGTIAEHPGKIDINHYAITGADWHHANSLNYNPSLDQIAISVRDFNEVWVIDHGISTEAAAGPAGDLIYRWGNPQAYGQGTADDQRFFGQHHVHWIEEGLPDAGQLLVFNNGRNRPSGAFTEVLKLDTRVNAGGGYALDANGRFLPDDVAFSYTAQPDPTVFYSWFISGAQQLPNGNLLIDDGAHGTFFEITPNGEEVWRYVNPVSRRGRLSQGESIIPEGNTTPDNFVFRATRYGFDYPAFEERELAPIGPIELNPVAFGCEAVVGLNDPGKLVPTSLYPNPAQEYSTLAGPDLTGKTLYLHNSNGQLLWQQRASSAQVRLNLAHLPSGMYFLTVEGLSH